MEYSNIFRIQRDNVCLTDLFSVEEGHFNKDFTMWHRVSPVFTKWADASTWLQDLKDNKVERIKL